MLNLFGGSGNGFYSDKVYGICGGGLSNIAGSYQQYISSQMQDAQMRSYINSRISESEKNDNIKKDVVDEKLLLLIEE